VHIDNPGEPENRFTLTVRVRAVAHYSSGTMSMDVPGETRRAFYVVRDPDLANGFPIALHSSGESSGHMADVDEDGHPEMIVPTAGGIVHAIRADGTEAAGFPVHTDAMWGHGTRAGEPDYSHAPAYNGAGRALDPSTIYEPIIAAAGIADLDGDHHLEIVVGGYQGGIFVFRHDGTPYGHGFPVRLPIVPSSANSPDARTDRGIGSSIVLADLDGDTHPEIIAGGFDGVLYAFDAATGAPHAGFPVPLHNTTNPSNHNRIFGGITVGRFNDDNIPDLLVASSESLLSDDNTGVLFLVHGDGTQHAGGPLHPHWPIVLTSVNVLPDIGEGIANALPAADLDGDHIDDIALYGTASVALSLSHTVLDHDLPQPVDIAAVNPIRSIHTLSRGSLSNAVAPGPFVTTLNTGAFGDLNADGTVDFAIQGGTLSVLSNITGAGRSPYEHQLGAWSGSSGAWLPGFPRTVEDFGFISGPMIADLSGDGYPEVGIGTGAFMYHAWDACGREAPGFPKFTGQWNMTVPSVGDMDGDGHVEFAANTRNGLLFAWHTQGPANGVQPWPTWRHDNANTGNYGTPLDTGTRMQAGIAPLQCPSAPIDGGVTDASTDAAPSADGGGNDAGQHTTAGGGCGCRVGSSRSTSHARGAAFLFALALVVRRRRKRAIG
jgi:MYXO-CTERM domain-containing protein